jgi:glycosyltransferase involved in cell wall biosynthesis
LKCSVALSVVVVTKNEEARLGRALDALRGFDDITVVDSASMDRTADIARNSGARLENFIWNGRYPKKYGWCLEHLKLKNDWVLFIDADEIMTKALMDEIARCDFSAAGYFIKGRYEIGETILKYGLQNNKLCLLNRHKFEFPVVDDLDIEGMGEIEGHYQPVLKPPFAMEQIGQMKSPLHHHIDDWGAWYRRHERYAIWEAAMDQKGAWPLENNPGRRLLKKIFKSLPLRPWVAFLHSYVLKAGFLDGAAGFKFAKARFWYYRQINRAALNANKKQA